MPPQPNLYHFEDVHKLAPALREYVVKAQNAAIKHHTAFRIAISGGSLPKTLAKALLDQSSQNPEDKVDFAAWDIFFADERIVKLDDPDSNFGLLKSELLDKIPKDQIGDPKVHVINTEKMDDSAGVADDYNDKLVKTFAAKDSVKIPIFDLILLGNGPDGHTASLFPGHKLLRETEGWVLSIEDSPKPPPRRITLSLPVIHAATQIAFVSTGDGKRDILKTIFDEEAGQDLPAGLVNKSGSKVSWFCDFAAASGIQNFPKKSSL